MKAFQSWNYHQRISFPNQLPIKRLRNGKIKRTNLIIGTYAVNIALDLAHDKFCKYLSISDNILWIESY